MKRTQGTVKEETRAIVYEELESWARMKIQGFIQDLLEEEVTELLGRQKHQRREEVDAPKGCRNGYGKERELSLSRETIKGPVATNPHSAPTVQS